MRIFLIALLAAISYAQTACNCIGAGELSGIIAKAVAEQQTVYEDDKLLLIAGGYGETCRAWDHPDLKDSNNDQLTPYPKCEADSALELDGKCTDDNWCLSAWCYVNATTCTDATTMRARSDTFDDTELFYTYDLCGAVDCFGSPETFGCPNDPVQNPNPSVPHTDSTAQFTDLGCAAEACICQGELKNNDGSANMPVAYDARLTDGGAPVCIACPSDLYEIKTSNIAAVGNSDLLCNRCVSQADEAIFYDAVVCSLPDDAPTGYVYDDDVATRISGVCTDISCNAPNLVEISCADNYMAGSSGDATERFNPYVPANGPFVTNEGCSGSNRFANLRGCVPEKPVTEVFEFDDPYVGNESPYSGTTTTHKYNLCSTSADCRPGHGWCDQIDSTLSQNQADTLSDGKPTTRCMECPATEAHCDEHALINTPAECKSACFGGTPTYARKECVASFTQDSFDSVVFDTQGQCDPGEFCMLEAEVTNFDAPSTVKGVCQLCELVDPARTGQCVSSKNFQNKYVAAECSKQCGRGAIQPEPPLPTEDFIRFSDLEGLGEVETGDFGGFCADSTRKKNLCNDINGFSLAAEGDHLASYSKYIFADYETANNNECSERYCGNVVETDPGVFTGVKDEAGGTHCLVQTKATGTLCKAVVDGGTLGNDVVLTGTCQNGYCVLGGQVCPNGYKEVLDADNNNVFYNPAQSGEACKEENRGTRYLSTFDLIECTASDGRCDEVPRANQVLCTSISHKDQTDWKVNDHYAQNTGAVDTYFYFMYFLATQTYGLSEGMATVDLSSPDYDIQGRAIVCDPNMPDDMVDQYKCLISEPGEYVYAGATIKLVETSNSTSRIYQMKASPQMFPFYMVYVCPGVNTNRCMGGGSCDYKKIPAGQLECAGSFLQCERMTTNSPTKPPTGTPTSTSTAHGDPIIWTFHGECYDLNKDGLYDATVNPRFNQAVKIGVYNDFMREISVVDDDGNVMISINSLGEYETQKFPYHFDYEEKDCPLDMKKTECFETYKEWTFDVQEFHYTVQLLRHDYKDAGIPEGDLGYHLDIYPRPYKSFYREGHVDMYSGLFFENPLPEELEYCQGGSNRNTRIKNEQSLAKDSHPLFN